MMRRSSALLALALVLTATALAACTDDGGLAPVSHEDVSGTYVSGEPAGATTQVADTIRLTSRGTGTWVTWSTSTTGSPQQVDFRGLLYELEGAVLGIREGWPCPPNATCMATERVGTMRGLLRGDTLDLWYTGRQRAVVPMMYRFLRVSTEP